MSIWSQLWQIELPAQARELLGDVANFMRINQGLITTSPLNIYLSALSSYPHHSLLRRVYPTDLGQLDKLVGRAALERAMMRDFGAVF